MKDEFNKYIGMHDIISETELRKYLEQLTVKRNILEIFI